MFAQENRLKKDKDVQNVVKKGKSVFDYACGLKFKQNSLETSRFAVVVGLKVHKSAVKRNKVRRQYREIIKSFLPEMKNGFDVVLLTRKDCLDLDFFEKEERLRKVFRKSGLLV